MNKRFKKLRNYLKLTQLEMSDSLGKKPRVIAYYESGERNITLKLARALENLFNVNVNWLITGEGAMFNESVGKRFQSLREALDLTQEEMAEKLDIEDVVIRFYETDRYDIDIKMALKLKKLFKVNVDWLMMGTGTMFGSGPDLKDNNLSKVKNNSSDELIIDALYDMSEKDKADILRYIKEKQELSEYRKSLKREKK